MMEVQKLLNDPLLQEALATFAVAELRTNNSDQLFAVADKLSEVGQRFARTCDPVA